MFTVTNVTKAFGPKKLFEEVNVTFSAGGHDATFEIRASSVLNPFALPALGQFRCPGPF